MRNRETDLRAEIDAHLQMAIADRVSRGASPEEAAAAARRELGNVAQIQEATRDVWGRRWVEQAWQDVAYAIRTFRRSPGFALVAIASLALGIGANTALFEVVNAVRLRTLPVAEPSSLVEVRIADMDGVRGSVRTQHASVTQPIWRAIEARQQALSGLFAWSRTSFNLAQGGEVRLADGLWASGDFFTTLGVHPAAGRLLSHDDDRPGCPVRAVLGNGFWHRMYGADPSVVGRTLTLGSHPAEIIGVAPPGFFGLEVGRAFDVVLPLCAEPAFSSDGKGLVDAGTTWWLSVFGRRKPDWSAERADAHFRTISADVFRESLPSYYPSVSVHKYLDLKLETAPGGSGLSQLREHYGTALWILLAIAGTVLIIACANLANLLLARASAREREIGVRLGLGASRGRVVRQLLTESLVLVLVGVACAIVLADALSRWLVTALETSDNPITLALGLDWTVLGFASLLAMATCLLFALAPAIRGTRVATSVMMRIASRGTAAAAPPLGMRRALVVIQIALSLALLFGSLLFARTLHNVLRVHPGFEADGLVVANINLAPLGLPPDRQAAARQAMIARVQGVPGVQGAAAVAVVPISGSSGSNEVWPERDRARGFNSYINRVGRGFFSMMETPILAGRDFDQRDTPQSVPVAIVNEIFARKLGGAQAAVGQRFTREATPRTPEETYQIVGVAANSNYRTLTEEAWPIAYYADAQDKPDDYAQLVIRSSLSPAAAMAGVTGALAEISPRIQVRYTVVSTMIHDTLIQERLLAALSGGFAGLAALLTTVGLYGLIAYTVSRRTGEFGVRIALGATRWDITRLLAGETSLLLAIGTACGIAIAMAAGRAAETLLFGVGANDAITLAGSALLLVAIALAACVMPVRRATRIEPIAALRSE